MISQAILEKGPAILDAIKHSKKILLHLHPRPDGDSVGSALGMRQVLLGMDKEVTIIRGDSPFPQYLEHLPGTEAVVPKNIFEIDLASFDLFIIQDSSALGHVSSLGPIVFPPNLKTISIDHHISNENYAHINLVDPGYPSVCELLFDLFQSWKVALSHDAAIPFFVGMYTDTGGFRHAGTTARTFAAAAKLAEIAPDFTKTLFAMDNINTKEKLAYQGLALSSIKTYLRGRVALSAVSFESLEQNHIPAEDAKSDIANMLKSVAGWDIGISMVEEVAGTVKVSMRTRDADTFDLSRIAVALGGGGHKAAAGVVIRAPLPQAVALVLETVEALYGKVLNS
jgi:phosphoesterase RecJ-like protein